MRSHDKPVILLVAEAVTLAHFARIAAVAQSLKTSSYQIVVATDPRYVSLDRSFSGQFYPLWSVPSEDFASSLAQGKPLYDAGTLTRYVEDDLALLDAVRPDLVIGDFRLSLAVSAPLRKVPYAAIVNAYWSPYAEIGYPVPDLPFTRLTGLVLGQKLFDFVRPFAFSLHARPLNKVRRHYGLTQLGNDLRKTYTWGDYTLYADIPEVVPMRPLPDSHRFLGPILWSTQTPLPDWWDGLPDNKPVVFVTLGSSGRADLLPIVIKVLSEFPVSIIAATAGKIALENRPSNVFVADYLPMDIASQRSDLVISNGGSLTTYQALACGVPVIGICSNMDQLLNMSALEKLRVGIRLRSSRMAGESLHKAVTVMLETQAYRRAAASLAQLLGQYNWEPRLGTFITEILR
jgi:UDP:flavonoid glycosyltransferase YjiC (YdhE family)